MPRQRYESQRTNYIERDEHLMTMVSTSSGVRDNQIPVRVWADGIRLANQLSRHRSSHQPSFVIESMNMNNSWHAAIDRDHLIESLDALRHHQMSMRAS